MDARAVCLAFIILLAGCNGLTGGDSVAPTPDPTTTHTDTPDPVTATAEPTPTRTPYATVHPDNPYEKTQLDVAIFYNDSSSDNRTRAVREALDYWENNSQEYLGYELEYRIVDPDNVFPDIELTFVSEIEQCGRHTGDNYVGCADLVTEEANLKTYIEIESGYTTNTTRETIKHEIGHTLGLEHGDEPGPVMNATGTTVPIEETVRYSLEIDDSYTEDAIQRQLNGGLGYLESGANGTLTTDVTFSEVSPEENATLDIVISDARDACPDGNVTCLDIQGNGSEYIQYELTTADIIDDYIGWTVAANFFSIFEARGWTTGRPTELYGEDVNADEEWWE
jgi:hypothetical protein